MLSLNPEYLNSFVQSHTVLFVVARVNIAYYNDTFYYTIYVCKGNLPIWKYKAYYGVLCANNDWE